MGFKVKYWGTRGSIPTPGPQTSRYGGNTACVAVEPAGGNGGRILVLDAGTGIRLLGNDLLGRREPNAGLEIDLLITHTHWDHIQGLPFFAPFSEKTNQVRIWGARQGDTDLEVILRRQMDPAVFPIPLDDLDAELSVNQLDQSEFQVGDFRIRTMRVRHPGNTLAYRIESGSGGGRLAFVPDNELGEGGDYGVGPGWRDEFVAFLDGVDVLVHDAMYTEPELESHRGWGHSSYEEAVRLAAEARVGRVALFHHRPDHGDADMDRILHEARSVAGLNGRSLEIVAAMEGEEFHI